MSYCLKDGKDIIMFVTEEDHKAPSSVNLSLEPEQEPGLILPNGDINWNCPCLGGMATGPCGYEFRSAFSCFHYSKEEPKGSECFEEFKKMTECMAKYPKLYDTDTEDALDIEAEDKTDEPNLDKEAHSANSDDTNASTDSSPKS